MQSCSSCYCAYSNVAFSRVPLCFELDRGNRLRILDKIGQLMSDETGPSMYFPIQEIYKRIESLLVVFIKDQNVDEEKLLKRVLQSLVVLFRRCLQHYQ
jgi:hypothetical protein